MLNVCKRVKQEKRTMCFERKIEFDLQQALKNKKKQRKNME